MFNGVLDHDSVDNVSWESSCLCWSRSSGGNSCKNQSWPTIANVNKLYLLFSKIRWLALNLDSCGILDVSMSRAMVETSENWWLSFYQFRQSTLSLPTISMYFGVVCSKTHFNSLVDEDKDLADSDAVFFFWQSRDYTDFFGTGRWGYHLLPWDRTRRIDTIGVCNIHIP